MAVDRRAGEFGADLVELVAEVGHLLRAVFIARNDLVDRVDDDRQIPLVPRPADELRSELVHREALPAQVPDVDIPDVRRRDLHRGVYVPEAVETARPVQLQIHIEYAPLRAPEPPHPV